MDGCVRWLSQGCAAAAAAGSGPAKAVAAAAGGGQCRGLGLVGAHVAPRPPDLVAGREAALDHAAYVVGDGQAAELAAGAGLDGGQQRIQAGGGRQGRGDGGAAVHSRNQQLPDRALDTGWRREHTGARSRSGRHDCGGGRTSGGALGGAQHGGETTSGGRLRPASAPATAHPAAQACKCKHCCRRGRALAASQFAPCSAEQCPGRSEHCAHSGR